MDGSGRRPSACHPQTSCAGRSARLAHHSPHLSRGIHTRYSQAPATEKISFRRARRQLRRARPMSAVPATRRFRGDALCTISQTASAETLRGRAVRRRGGRADRGQAKTRRRHDGRLAGGHGDPRPPELSCCLGGGHMAEVVDGVDALRRAARECLRSGAHAIKIMAWGGVISPRGSPVCWRSICGGLLGGTRRYGLWRVAEDDPDSDLYAESSDVAALPATVGGRAVLDVLNDDRVL